MVGKHTLNLEENDEGQNEREFGERVFLCLPIYLPKMGHSRRIIQIISSMTAKSDLETPLPPAPDDNNLFLLLLARAQCPAESATVITPHNPCSSVGSAICNQELCHNNAYATISGVEVA